MKALWYEPAGLPGVGRQSRSVAARRPNLEQARPEIQNPATVKRLIVDLIQPVRWTAMQADVKGDTEKNPEGRWRSFSYDELEKRDKLNLDIFWLRDKSLEDSDDLPEPDVLAQEIADDLQAALEQFAGIAAELRR